MTAREAERPGPVAVIDVGSNSIKLLVADRAAGGSLEPRLVRTREARISAGLGEREPVLGEAGMARGLEAVQALLAEARPLRPRTFLLVATSAVRDARNGAEFCARVRAATGHSLRILSGDEEARLIGRGLGTDPALHAHQDFYVFDLGGGSLECLAFRGRRIAQAASLPLGCVRLTERFVPDPTQPQDAAVHAAIERHVREQFARDRFRFSLPAGTPVVGTGGTVTTARALLGVRRALPWERTAPLVTVASLAALRDELGALPLAPRRRIAGLPPARADVFPVALTTLLTVAGIGGFTAFHHSVCNLRHGLADEALAGA